MTPIEKAVEECRSREMLVYRDSPTRIERDVKSVASTVNDHTGRWPFEVLQNSDDANAEEVLIRITETAVYIADNGCGLKPDAVDSLCGTHLSNKPDEAIGCKGLGFKAVYEVTSSPAVFTGKRDGVEFCREKARVELNEFLRNAPGSGPFVDDDHVPYQWLPFWVSRREAAESDPVLEQLAAWETVVRLPCAKGESAISNAMAVLRTLPPHVLLTFKNLKRLQIICADGDRRIERKRQGAKRKRKHAQQEIWTVIDASANDEQSVGWLVRRKEVSVPEEHLQTLDVSDRKRNRRASVLVAAPISPAGAAAPVDEYPQVCVYYPVGEDEQSGRAPVPLLLHADFTVSSDRKHVLPFDKFPRNAWIADCLAEEVVAFVDDGYCRDQPAAFLRLIRPDTDCESHSLSSELWKRIKLHARDHLKLPNAAGDRRRLVKNSRFMATTVAKEEARAILDHDDLSKQLVHDSLEQDEAVATLKALGCDGITDEDLINCIKRTTVPTETMHDWLWKCWGWLARWLYAWTSHDEKDRRLRRIKGVRILPIKSHRYSLSELDPNTVVTWRDADVVGDLPDWLPIRFLNDWFRDLFDKLSRNHEIRSLARELGIVEPNDDTVFQAFQSAIENYWEEPSGDPARFLEFLRSRDWHKPKGETATDGVRRCPILVGDAGGPENPWCEAGQAYFGAAWGEALIAELYRDAEGVAWARPNPTTCELDRPILEWLGVSAFPRVVHSFTDEPVVKEVAVLDHISLDELDRGQTTSLLVLLARHWAGYYRGNPQTGVEYTPYAKKPDRINAFRWHDLIHNLKPMLRSGQSDVPLFECWLPDSETDRAIGDLLPIIDLDVLGDDWDNVARRLLNANGIRRQSRRLRTSFRELTTIEWRDMLTKAARCVDASTAAENKASRIKIRGWYETAVDGFEEKGTDRALADVPLLCRRGDEWRFVTESDGRWLEDHLDWADAFRAEVWMFDVHEERRVAARRLFGLGSLKNDVQQIVLSNLEVTANDPEWQKSLDAIKPFMFAAFYQKKEAARLDFRDLLRSLRVGMMPRIEVELKLAGHKPKRQDRPFWVDDASIVLSAGYADVSYLAPAVAQALNKKQESDFIDVLLRCNDESEIRCKLESRNISTDQIDERVSEYRAMESEPAAGGVSREAANAQPRNLALNAPPNRHSDDRESSVEHAGREMQVTGIVAEANPLSQRAAGSQAVRPDDSDNSGSSDSDAEDAALKDGAHAPYHIKRPDTPGRSPSSSTGVTAGILRNEPGYNPHDAENLKLRENAQDDNGALTRQQKDDIEHESRLVAERELQRRGYDPLNRMPPHHKGYDLRATQGDATLLVEVKGHLRASNISQVTAAQMEEHDRCRDADGGEAWQLWNIEHLAASDENEITITIVTRIPPEVRRAERYRINVRECECEQDAPLID